MKVIFESTCRGREELFQDKCRQKQNELCLKFGHVDIELRDLFYGVKKAVDMECIQCVREYSHFRENNDNRR